MFKATRLFILSFLSDGDDFKYVSMTSYISEGSVAEAYSFNPFVKYSFPFSLFPS